jgi:two-component system cell cycle sensor histidine kinase/response regulator CckA
VDAPGPVVLLVEDDDQVRQLLVNVLTSHGFEVLPAASGEDAVVVAQARHIDLLLSDIVLPKMDGFQTATCVREWAPHAPALFMSGYVSHASASAAGPDLASTVLRKPFAMTALLDRIREALAA